ncbi:MAG: hypothetical protein EF806_03475 [Candidatus Methanoliparum thermophilum]|uniref:Uncharacterized protein n=1 Tax=Methanoliparum thermophilum TaxID=2491083 RepID=A0A520KSB0_METT2|nr:MAG: hypothetical protein EF806_03475 [Candidatus Methanoliparum thermophilum]
MALIQFDYEMKYKELKNHVDRFATALADLGVKKGMWSRLSYLLLYNSSYVIWRFQR